MVIVMKPACARAGKEPAKVTAENCAWHEGVAVGMVVEEIDGTEGSGTGGGVGLVHSPGLTARERGHPAVRSRLARSSLC